MKVVFVLLRELGELRGRQRCRRDEQQRLELVLERRADRIVNRTNGGAKLGNCTGVCVNRTCLVGAARGIDRRGARSQRDDVGLDRARVGLCRRVDGRHVTHAV